MSEDKAKYGKAPFSKDDMAVDDKKSANREGLSNMLETFHMETVNLLEQVKTKALFSISIIDILLRLEDLTPEMKKLLSDWKSEYMLALKFIKTRKFIN